MVNIQLELAKIQSETSVNERTRMAEQLSNAIRRRMPAPVAEADVDALARMMADPDDSVRYWIAISLGLLGAQANRAVPQLEKALAEVACVQASKTSADGIRLALSQIGVKPPDIECK